MVPSEMSVQFYHEKTLERIKNEKESGSSECTSCQSEPVRRSVRSKLHPVNPVNYFCRRNVLFVVNRNIFEIQGLEKS